MENPDNAGLQRAIDSLEVARSAMMEEGITMTRADLWALAGKIPPQISLNTNHFYSWLIHYSELGGILS